MTILNLADNNLTNICSAFNRIYMPNLKVLNLCNFIKLLIV